jgi:hypothetical protein
MGFVLLFCRIDSKTFKKLSKAIVSLFPIEKQSSYYHQARSSISGRLYVAYNEYRAMWLFSEDAKSLNNCDEHFRVKDEIEIEEQSKKFGFVIFFFYIFI